MCGIAGYVGSRPVDASAIDAALAGLHHRGPDGRGTVTVPFGAGSATLLHTRLAIIDLDERSNQPFRSDDCVLTYNGEVYNYTELRAELADLGHTFVTTSDTEVVVKAWRQWGSACVERFEGMWAFALVDLRNDTVFLSRDRFGEKPMFFNVGEGGLWFASDVATLSALSGKQFAANLDHVRRYLVNGYKSLFKHPDTFFEDVRSLPPATSIELRAGDDVAKAAAQPRRYWTLKYAPRSMSAGEARDGVAEHLFRAVQLRLRSDVPVAFCLSGGVDSSTLAAVAVKKFNADVTAFSIIDQDERYDERDNIEANVRAIGCRHVAIPTSRLSFVERLERQSAGRSAPVATISYYVHNFLSEAMHEAGYKVAVSGTAADELFSGYYDHYNFWLAQMRGRADFEALLEDWYNGCGRVVRNPVLRDPMSFAEDPGRRDHIYLDRDYFNNFMISPCPEDFFETAYTDDTLRNRMLNELFEESVPVLLQEDDSNSMQYSVENRSPYLDSALAEFIYSVPSEHLIGDGCMKRLLRDAGEGLVPDQVRLDKVKKGFNASIDSLLDRDDPDVVDRLLADGPIFDIVRRDAVEKFLTSDLTDNSFSKFMFSFISARLFLDGLRNDGSASRRHAA